MNSDEEGPNKAFALRVMKLVVHCGTTVGRAMGPVGPVWDFGWRELPGGVRARPKQSRRQARTVAEEADEICFWLTDYRRRTFRRSGDCLVGGVQRY